MLKVKERTFKKPVAINNNKKDCPVYGQPFDYDTLVRKKREIFRI